MPRISKLFSRFAALALASAVAGCAWPTGDESTLKAIAAECQQLMRTVPPYPSHGATPSLSAGSVPKDKWSPAVASLNPMWITIFEDGCVIQIKPMFDGGWGYFVPRAKNKPPEPEGRFSDLGYGVYWFHPY